MSEQVIRMQNTSEEVAICTHSGVMFRPFAMNPGTVTLDDISWHLSRICRFNGATEYFYSVAQHSVLVQDLIASKLENPDGREEKLIRLAALMHDAAEAYIGDMARPIKRMFPAIEDVEYRLTRYIFKELGIPWPTQESWEAIKYADLMACELEQRDLMPKTEWWARHEHEGVAPIQPWPMEYGEALFLRTYLELGGNVL